MVKIFGLATLALAIGLFAAAPAHAQSHGRDHGGGHHGGHDRGHGGGHGGGSHVSVIFGFGNGGYYRPYRPAHYYGYPGYYPYYAAPPTVVYAPPPTVIYGQPAPVNYVTPNLNATQTSPTYTDSDGNSCREFQSTAIIGGVKQATYGTACYQPDGTWRVVN